MASLGRLVAGVAHELNNPISFLLGNVSALRKYADRLEQYLGAVHAGPLPPELAALRQRLRIDAALADLPSVIDGMTEGAHRTADIVNALKRFSVIDRAERSPVDLGQVVEQAIHWVRKGAAPDFRIDWTPPAEPVQVMGSAGQLLQVMLNLIQNAADACAGRPEGRLRITLEPRSAGRQAAAALCRQRTRHRTRACGAGVRPLLHHQAGGQGHGAGPVDQLRPDRPARRPPQPGPGRRGRRRVHGGAAGGRGGLSRPGPTPQPSPAGICWHSGSGASRPGSAGPGRRPGAAGRA
jgi:two-component system sensor histidine kinase HupT/HoxJ